MDKYINLPVLLVVLLVGIVSASLYHIATESSLWDFEQSLLWALLIALFFAWAFSG